MVTLLLEVIELCRKGFTSQRITELFRCYVWSTATRNGLISRLPNVMIRENRRRSLISRCSDQGTRDQQNSEQAGVQAPRRPATQVPLDKRRAVHSSACNGRAQLGCDPIR